MWRTIRTINIDGIKLQDDHKTPRAWGGKPVAENLWAICELYSRDKIDVEAMKTILGRESVHERIPFLLKLNHGKFVSNDFIQFVANFEDF